MSRAVHPKKDIEQVLNFVEQNGWRIEVGGVMHGEKCIARTQTKNAAVVNFASRAFGLRQRTR